MQPEEVLKYFQIEGAVEKMAPFGLGHINQTYLINTADQELLLQSINTDVFRSPEILEQNIQQVLLKFPQLFPSLIKTKEGSLHFIQGTECWRLQAYEANTYSPDEVKNLEEAASVADGFSEMSQQFLQEEPRDYQISIPNFHDLSWRLEQLEEAKKNNSAQRLLASSELLKKAESFHWISSKMDDLIAQGLPERLCHNDAKVGNILLNKADHSFAKIIDLDTLGPGYLLYDYGDIMRSLFALSPENEVDLEKVEVRPEFLKALKQAYIQKLGGEIALFELENLEFGGLYMTYIMGIRFLTDYLNGDVYYKIGFPNENFIRARNQFKLLELMKEVLDRTYR